MKKGQIYVNTDNGTLLQIELLDNLYLHSKDAIRRRYRLYGHFGNADKSARI